MNPIILQTYPLGCCRYEPTWRDMQRYTEQRDADSEDQLWLLEHPPTYTLGLAAKSEHLLNPDEIIPVIQTDRGGQVTYHGPGQLMAYILLDLRRAKLGIRVLVSQIEQAVIGLLKSYDIEARTRVGAPGVYVGNKKIAALGLRVRRGCTYHGLSLNVDMDIEPFSRINPCGYSGLEVTQLADFGESLTLDRVGSDLSHYLMQQLNCPG